MKGRTIKFVLLTTWILLTRGIDLYATSNFTPDLSREGNPLVSLGGLNWTPLIIIVVCLSLYSIYALYITTFREYELLPTEKGLKFMDFFTYIHLGERGHWTSVMFKLPKDKKRLTHIMGHLLPAGLSFAGLVTTIMWYLIDFVPNFYNSYYSLNSIYSIIFIGTTTIWTVYYLNLFREYNESEEGTRHNSVHVP